MLGALSHPINSSKHSFQFPLFGMLLFLGPERLVWVLVFNYFIVWVLYTSILLEGLSNFYKKFRRQILLNSYRFFIIVIFDWFSFEYSLFVFSVVNWHSKVCFWIVRPKEIHKLAFNWLSGKRIEIFPFKLNIFQVNTSRSISNSSLYFWLPLLLFV